MRKLNWKPSNINLSRTDKEPVKLRTDVLEHFAGRKKDTLYNAEGCTLNVEAVLARTYPADPFKLFVKVGSQWFETLTVKPDDPAIMALRESGDLIAYGKTPDQLEHERKRKEEARTRIEQEEAHKRSREEHHKRRIAEGEAKQRRAIESMYGHIHP